MMMANWFIVDRKGLAEIAKRRGMHFVITEPIQNAWDEATRMVEVVIEAQPGRPLVDLMVTDDSPNGFQDLADSYSMFRESRKLENPEQRGRFNIGEKLLLAMAKEARIISTTGSVIFDKDGRRRSRKRVGFGSTLTATLRMTRKEMDEALALVNTLIPPAGITTIINGKQLPDRKPAATGERRLETEVRGAEGGFKRTYRKTEVRIYEPLDGEEPHLYEMGIPVDKLDCPWHVEVMQKVPLTIDRAAVGLGYRLTLEQQAAELMADQMTEEQAVEPWVATALVGMEDDEAIKHIARQRFGKKSVTFDPSDPEANKEALDRGYRLVHGRELTKHAWDSIRRTKALKPAGQVFTDHKIATSPDGTPPVPRSDWNVSMEELAAYAGGALEHLLGRHVAVGFHRLPRGVAGCASSGGMFFATSFVRKARTGGWDQEMVDALIIHEAAHVAGIKDHLSHRFHQKCCEFGASLRSFAERLPGASR
jgi:hypothetical protein